MARNRGPDSPSLTCVFSSLRALLLKDVNPNKCLIFRVDPYSDLSISLSRRAGLVGGAGVFLEVC